LPEKRHIFMSSFSLSDSTRFEGLLRGAGFTNVSVVRDMRGAEAGSFREYWDSVEAGIGSIPQSYLLLSEADRRAVREEVRAKLSKFEIDGILRMTNDAVRRLKRLFGTELPIIPILGFALLPWFWMMLSSIRPDATPPNVRHHHTKQQ